MIHEVIYEDNHILVVNKPAGLLTQPSGTDQESLEAICKAYIKAKYKKPGAVFLEAVHRLDKPASGIVLFARTSKALSRLNEILRSKQCKKIYTAYVEGKLPAEQDALEHYLKHDDHYAAIVDSQHPDAKLSKLHYRVIGHHPLGDIVEIALETGRYHQIRAQFSAAGYPILGDVKYGAKHHFQKDAIALHHSKMEIPHPISKQLLTFEAPFNSP